MDELVEPCQGKHGGVGGWGPGRGRYREEGQMQINAQSQKSTHWYKKLSSRAPQPCPLCVRNYPSVRGHGPPSFAVIILIFGHIPPEKPGPKTAGHNSLLCSNWAFFLTFGGWNRALCRAQTVPCYGMTSMNSVQRKQPWTCSRRRVWGRYSAFQFGQGVTPDSHLTTTSQLIGEPSEK